MYGPVEEAECSEGWIDPKLYLAAEWPWRAEKTEREGEDAASSMLFASMPVIRSEVSARRRLAAASASPVGL